ncbi:MAG: AAA family ATPase [Gemmatales bacterium]|nr:AAA family ATPase [Gemmatales bacterium]MDW8386422.1 AAA domain-containing protein [Gemmatales bacterium]
MDSSRSPAPPQDRSDVPWQRRDHLRQAFQHYLCTQAENVDVVSAHHLGSSVPRSGADVISALLCGILPPTDSAEPEQPLTWFDTSLTAEQRQAVRQALAVEDLFLLLGEPGTGKSRVVAEIIAQAAWRKQRVLLTAARPAALDACLERLHGVLAVRLLGPQEDADQLPEVSRRLLLGHQAERLNRQLADHARQLGSQETEQNRAMQEEARLLVQMRSLAVRRRELDQQRNRLIEEKAGIREVVETEAAQADAGGLLSSPEGLSRMLAEEYKRHLATLEDLDARIRQAAQACAQKEEEHAAWLARVREQEEVVETRKRWNPFSLRFWKCWLQGRAPQRLEEFRQRALEAASALQAAHAERETLEQQRAAAEQRHACALHQIIADEVARRLAEVDARLYQLDRELEGITGSWSACRSRFRHPEAISSLPSLEAVEALEESSQKAAKEQTSVHEFAVTWQSDLANGMPDQFDWLPCFAVVAAPVDAVLSGHIPIEHGTGFDMVIVEQADRLDDAELLAAARRGRQCILVGLPPWPSRAEVESLEPAFHRLWHRLHPFLRHRDCRWIQSDSEIVCQLQAVPDADRQRLEAEPLADHPEVELRILGAEDNRPVLAEVAFPRTSFSITRAKEFLFQQLGELPLRPESEQWRWSENGESLVLELSDADAVCSPDAAIAGAVRLESDSSDGTGARVELERGIVEVVAGRPLEGSNPRAMQWCTQRLEFSRAAGWDHAAVARWLKERVGPIDLRRTSWLTQNHRASRALADFLRACWSVRSPSATRLTLRVDKPPVRLEIVQPDAGLRPAGKPAKARHASESLGQNPPHIDLADPRQRQRLPLELQLKLPMRGTVNLVEAEHVVGLLAQLIGCQNGLGGPVGSFAVLSWSAPQVLVIEHLWRKTTPAENERIIFAPLCAFRDREADVVVVSLVRSSATHAAPLAEHPSDWWTVLGSARHEVILVGDPAAPPRRSGGELASSPACEEALRLERLLYRRLLHHLAIPSARAGGVAVAEDQRS